MRATRFTEEQIIGILAEGDAGGSAKDICRRHGISEQTFYRWRRKYGGMDVSEARRLRELEREKIASPLAGRTARPPVPVREIPRGTIAKSQGGDSDER